MYSLVSTTEFGLGAAAKKHATPKPAISAAEVERRRKEKEQAEYWAREKARPDYVFAGDVVLVTGTFLRSAYDVAFQSNASSVNSFRSKMIAALSRYFADIRITTDIPTFGDYQVRVQVKTKSDHGSVNDIEQMIRGAAEAIAGSAMRDVDFKFVQRQGNASSPQKLPYTQPGGGIDLKDSPRSNDNETGCGFLCGLGISTPVLLAGGALLFILLMRK